MKHGACLMRLCPGNLRLHEHPCINSYNIFIHSTLGVNKIMFSYVNWGACVCVQLSTQSKALLKVLTVCQHVKIFPASMKPECLLPSHQYFLPRVRYSALTVYFKIRWILFFHFYLDLTCRFSWNFPAKLLCLCDILDYHSSEVIFTIFYDVL
jgi:hypothetical protein